MNSQRTGRVAESILVNYLAGRGWELLARNRRFAYVEVDTLWRAHDGRFYIVESKSLRSEEVASSRLSRAQMKRLQIASRWLEGRLAEPVSVLLALVSVSSSQVELYDELGEWVGL